MDIKSSTSKSSSRFLSTSQLLQHEFAPEAEFSTGTTPYIASPRSTALKALTNRKEHHGFVGANWVFNGLRTSNRLMLINI